MNRPTYLGWRETQRRHYRRAALRAALREHGGFALWLATVLGLAVALCVTLDGFRGAL